MTEGKHLEQLEAQFLIVFVLLSIEFKIWFIETILFDTLQ